MTYPHGGASQIWRDGPAHDPQKPQIRDWGTQVETRITALDAARPQWRGGVVAGDQIAQGDVIRLAKSSGAVDTFIATRDFEWTDQLAHRFSADPEIVLVDRGIPRRGEVVTPPGFPVPQGFRIFHGGDRGFWTDVDTPEAYRAAFAPAVSRTYYVRNVTGSDSNSGTASDAAFKTFTRARTAVNSIGGGMIVLVHEGKAYDESDGMTHVSTLVEDAIILGQPDVLGFGPFLANAERPTDFAFAPSAAASWVYETATLAQEIGRVSDISAMRRVFIDFLTGWHVWVPAEYAELDTFQAVADTPGSFWEDRAGGKIYVHKLGGTAPVVSEDIVIPRSTAAITLNGSDTTTFLEGLTFLGDFATPLASRVYLSDCVSAYSRGNGFGFETVVQGGTRCCVSVACALDAFNYHNIGRPIQTVTRSNPARVTCTNHGLPEGYVVTIADVPGMPEIAGVTAAIANVAGNDFDLVGVDSSGFSEQTGTGKLRVPSSDLHEIRPVSISAGTEAGSNQSTTTHENCRVVTVEPYFAGSWRDHFAETNEAARIVWGGRLASRNTSVNDPNGRIIQVTDTAIAALIGVDWADANVSGAALFSAQPGATLKVEDVDLPMDASLRSNVSALV